MRRARTATPAGRRLAPHPPEGSPERLAAMSRAERDESFAVRQLETRLLTLRRKAERTDAQTKRAEEVADIHDQQVAESRRAAAYRDRVYTEEFVSRRSHVANEKKAKDAARSMMVSHFNDRQRAADEARSERQRLQTIRVRGDEDRTAALRAIAKDDRVQLKESLRRSAQMMQRKNLDAFADGEARRDELRKAHSERMSEEQEQRARSAARVRAGRAAVKQAKDALERKKHEERNGVLQQLTETKRQTTSELQRYRERLEEERRALEAKVRGQPRVAGRAAVKQAKDALERRKHEERNGVLQQLTETERQTTSELQRYRERLEEERRALEAKLLQGHRLMLRGFAHIAELNTSASATVPMWIAQRSLRAASGSTTSGRSRCSASSDDDSDPLRFDHGPEQ